MAKLWYDWPMPSVDIRHLVLLGDLDSLGHLGPGHGEAQRRGDRQKIRIRGWLLQWNSELVATDQTENLAHVWWTVLLVCCKNNRGYFRVLHLHLNIVILPKNSSWYAGSCHQEKSWSRSSRKDALVLNSRYYEVWTLIFKTSAKGILSICLLFRIKYILCNFI